MALPGEMVDIELSAQDEGTNRLNANEATAVEFSKTEMKKNCFVLSLLISIFALMVVTTAVYKSKIEERGERTSLAFVSKDGLEICITRGCNASATVVLKNMKPDVDPCDDFYEFACGNFLNDTDIAEDKNMETVFTRVNDMVMEQLKLIVSETASEGDISPVKRMKSLYAKCMDQEEIEKLGLNLAKETIARLGGWPVIEGSNWNESDFHWTKSTYDFRSSGLSPDFFVHLSVIPGLVRTNVFSLQLMDPDLGINREYYLKGWEDKVVAAYYKLMLDVATLFGANRTLAESDMKDVLQFEMDLAQIKPSAADLRNVTVIPMSIDELNAKFSYIDWLEYIRNVVFPNSSDSLAFKQAINGSEVIVVRSPRYLIHFQFVLEKTPKRTQANYVIWRAVISLSSFLSDNARNAFAEFSRSVSGFRRRSPRWKECVNYVCNGFSLACASQYVRRNFQEESKRKVREIVKDLREEMYNVLKNVDWMDHITRKHALDKAYAMEEHVGYPSELLDNEEIVEFYKYLNLSEDDSLYASFRHVSKFQEDLTFNSLGKYFNRSDWRFHSRADTVNAIYNAIENSIQLPAGILQDVFFAIDRPNYMNFGAIGYVIGHEITHAFDDKGRQFDKNGNLVDWWDPLTKKRYMEKTACIVEQYGNFSVKEVGGTRLNGIATQGENIADNGGLKLAYNAYDTWSRVQNSTEPSLPGLERFTPQQMFWISAANIWCSKYREEALNITITVDAHIPKKFRVLGAFNNQPEFARDFNCPLGSAMNTAHKCNVW